MGTPKKSLGGRYGGIGKRGDRDNHQQQSLKGHPTTEWLNLPH
ncbi:hypothetical protein [Geitlerinema sp. PCC 9228]|nr:hypothetical protein [Geitlerinema sp. PCC 9228]